MFSETPLRTHGDEHLTSERLGPWNVSVRTFRISSAQEVAEPEGIFVRFLLRPHWSIL